MGRPALRNCAFASLVIVMVLSIGIGSPVLSPAQVVRALGGSDGLTYTVIMQVRLPRIVLGALVGSALALSGLLLQDSLRNDLAGPELLGASSGAALAMAVLTVFAIPVPWALHPFVALIGAIAGGSLVIGLVGAVSSPDRVVVLGAAVSSMLGAGITAVIALSGKTANVNVLFTYLLGNLSARNWSHVLIVLPAALLIAALTPVLARNVELIKVGEAAALTFGVRVGRVRVAVLGAAALVCAAVTATCGPVAFVALLAPHLVRRLTHESGTGKVATLVAVTGALLLVVADRAAQLLIYPSELPVGVMTTAVGVPALLVLLRRRRTSLEMAR